MELGFIVLLALIQGLTEFLPISSSAHLILPSHLFGWDDQGLAFDVAVHVGTLAAVVWYFRKDIYLLIYGWLRSVTGGKASMHSRLGWMIILGTLPAVVAGLLLNSLIEQYLRSILVIAATTIFFGVLLGWADCRRTERYRIRHIGVKQTLFIGCAQAIALIPGTSRSGITITAALMLGFSRKTAARFSFFLSIPLIMAAGSFKCMELIQAGGETDWFSISLGAVLSAISAYICIHFFLKLINQIGMWPFVVYRLLLGAVLLVVAFTVPG